MKDEKRKYLMVNASDFKKFINLTWIGVFNKENINKHETHDVILAKSIFEKNCIPEEYQKIIVKVNIPIMFPSNYEAEEYTIGFPFDLTGGRLEKIDGRNIITASGVIKKAYTISFSTLLQYVNYENVMRFLKELDNDGYSKVYLSTIKQFFDLD